MVDTSKSKYLHLTPPDFVTLLEKLKFFEGYPPELRRRMSNAVESTFDAGIHGANKAHFQMFPGLALVQCSVILDHEAFDADITKIAQSSHGLFSIENASVEIPHFGDRTVDDDSAFLTFTLHGESCSFQTDWYLLQTVGFEFVGKKVSKHCDGVRPHTILHTCEAELMHVVYCTQKALKRIQKAKLIPTDYEMDIRENEFPSWVWEN